MTNKTPTLKLDFNLHWLHWLVVLASIGLTLVAWQIADKQLVERTENKFNREANHVVELIVERMQKYEDALWGGVASIHLNGGSVNTKEWKKFSNALNIEEKYPGINGIGVIYRVKPTELNSYLDRERKYRSDYQIHPKHNQDEYWPITYIEPVADNLKAVGLDMAHEKNRYTAAKKAMKSGSAQITGPIVLVQDSEKTPGFLFYVPYYSKSDVSNEVEKIENFQGLVYAPFVVKKLMKGVLNQENRYVNLSIRDGEDLLFNEHNQDNKAKTRTNRFEKTVKANVYGRTWVFDLRSNANFHTATASIQPVMILVGGIIIDTLLIVLFYLLGSANKRAILYAKQLDEEVKEQQATLVSSSKFAALGEMAGGVAHEINNPLAIIAGYINRQKKILKQEGIHNPKLNEISTAIEDTVGRIATIVKSMRALARDGSNDPTKTHKLHDVIHDAMGLCREKFKANGVMIDYENSFSEHEVVCNYTELAQVFINLLNNSYDAICESEKPWIKIEVKEQEGSLIVRFSDSGKGIPEEVANNILDPFFTTKDLGKGTGLGLSISKKIMEKHKGSISYVQEAKNTTFELSIPVAQEQSLKSAA